MAGLQPVDLGSPRLSSHWGPSPPGPSGQVWGWWSRVREVGEKVQSETRYFLTSLQAQGGGSLKPYGSTGASTMRYHWVFDVSLHEDACRMRTDKGAQTFSVLRHIAVNLLRRERRHKRGMKARRKRAGWG